MYVPKREHNHHTPSHNAAKSKPPHTMVKDLTVSALVKETYDDDAVAASAAASDGGGGGGGGEEVVSSESSSSSSALRDNISRKGKNAYYYAHAHRATGPEVSRVDGAG